MMQHLDGPTLIVTRMPDGGLAWTVISPQKMLDAIEADRQTRIPKGET